MQLTVSSFHSADLMDDSKRAQVLDALVGHQRDATRTIMGLGTNFSEPRRAMKARIASARYDGTAPEGARFATIVLVSPTGAWAFFLEGHDSDAREAFLSRADAIFDSIEVDGG